MRHASGFNDLYKAVMQKEIDLGLALFPNPVDCYPNPVVPGRSGEPSSHKQHGKRVKGKKRVSEVAEEVRRHAKALWNDVSGRLDTKWTWGINLTSEDLRRFVCGADK